MTERQTTPTVETYIVYPTNKHNRPAPPSKIPLHGLDPVDIPIDIRNHRFYTRPPSHLYNTTAEFIDRLKSALAEAIELYAPVSGVVKTGDKEGPHIALDADSRRGTPFLVERRDVPYIDDSEDLSPRLDPILPPESSALAVKVTLFSCGTIAIAASINHVFTDLRGHLDLLELWAQIVRGEPVDFTHIPDDWTRAPGRYFPDLMNTSTVSPNPPPGFKILPTAPTGPPAWLLVPSQAFRWRFTKSALQRLKDDFSPSPTSKDVWISSGDALAALLSGVISRARYNAGVETPLASETPGKESLIMAADGRERAPQGNMTNGKYFGNFNPLFSTTVSRSDLLSLTNESGSRIALEIRAALTLQLSPESLAQKISFFEANDHLERGRISWIGDIIFTNWSRNDLQSPKLDLGWGKPFAATNGGGTVFPPGYVLITQERSSGDMYVVISIEKAGADGLKADPLMNKYGELVKVL